MEETVTNPFLSGGVYDKVKFLVQIVLPAIGTLYFTLAGIWNLAYGEQVLGTVTALALFGGVILGISKRSYEKSDAKFDGAVNVDNEMADPYSLEFKKELPELAQKDVVTLKVNRASH